MDPISLGIGALIFAAGAAAKRFRHKPPTPPKTPRLECGCEHNYGAHENGDRCQAQIKRADAWGTEWSSSAETHWIWVQCPCQNYDGPEPLPRTWNPELWKGTPGELK